MADSEKLNLYVDALSFDERDGGFATVLRDLAKTLVSSQKLKATFVCHPKHKKIFEAYGVETLPVWFPYRLRFFISIVIMPFVSVLARPDLIHFEITGVPNFISSRSTVTVHDLHFMEEQDFHARTLGAWIHQKYWVSYFTRSLRRADRIKSISQHTIDEIAHRLKINSNVHLVYPRTPIEPQNFDLTPYPRDCEPLKLLFVGSLIPRKNLRYLLEALKFLRRPWSLAVIGNIWWGASSLLEQKDPRIQILGYVDDEALLRAYLDAHFLILPSVEEGFGLPIIEAMSTKTAVLASDIEIFREILLQDQLFGLEDSRNLAHLLEKMTEDRYLAALKFGSRQLEKFTPEAHLRGHEELFRLAKRIRDRNRT